MRGGRQELSATNRQAAVIPIPFGQKIFGPNGPGARPPVRRPRRRGAEPSTRGHRGFAAPDQGSSGIALETWRS